MITENLLHIYISIHTYIIPSSLWNVYICLYLNFFSECAIIIHTKKYRSFEVSLDFSLILVSYQTEFLFLTSPISQPILPPLHLQCYSRSKQNKTKQNLTTVDLRYSPQTSSTIINWEIVWNENLKAHPQNHQTRDPRCVIQNSYFKNSLCNFDVLSSLRNIILQHKI